MHRHHGSTPPRMPVDTPLKRSTSRDKHAAVLRDMAEIERTCQRKTWSMARASAGVSLDWRGL